MTVVVYKKEKERHELAADSQATWGSGKQQMGDGEETYIDHNKIFKVNDIMAGGAGSGSQCQAFKLFCSIHKPQRPTDDAILEFYLDFIKYMMEKKIIEKSSEVYFSSIIVFKGKAFRIAGFQVEEIKKHTAIGSGMFLALGALHYNHTAKEAVDVAKKHDLYCGGDTVTLEEEM